MSFVVISDADKCIYESMRKHIDEGKPLILRKCIHTQLTDRHRRIFLICKGYVPVPAYLNDLHALSDTEFVDSCIACGFCPAYWREARSQAEVVDNGNGMVMEKPGDRSRIDWYIALDALNNKRLKGHTPKHLVEHIESLQNSDAMIWINGGVDNEQ